jgi:hypothetical protein
MSGVFYIDLGEQFDAIRYRRIRPSSVIVLPGNASTSTRTSPR